MQLPCAKLLLDKLRTSGAPPSERVARQSTVCVRSVLGWPQVAAIALICASIGCTPGKYREAADRDANCLMDAKSAAAGVEPATYRINIDPRSRMYDPYDPDREPMPPDDPTSNQLMQCVDCKKGSLRWKLLPKTPFVENPGWLDSMPFNAQGQIVLDVEGAVQMALLDSPRYQAELEELYLSALDVSFERFRFDAQFFGGSSVFLTADGRDRSGSGSSSTEFEVSPLRPGNRLRFEKLCATGSQLVVGMANSLVWQFAGPDDYSGNTLLDFSLIQPLLRGAGRTRVLERLTITERNLLANVREMERYRKTFYVNIVTGRDPGNGPNRRGGVFGGSGLTGFTGVGGGGFGRVGGGNFGFGGGAGGGFTGGAGAQGAGGYLGLLQNEQVLRNQYANVIALRDSVSQLQASYEAGRIDRFQVDLARQAQFNAQSQLLTAQNSYQSQLESFLTGIGLPPELPVRIEDPMLDRLNLLDPELDKLQKEVSTVLDELRAIREQTQEEQEALAGGLVVPNLPNDETNRANKVAERVATLMGELTEVEEITAARIAAAQKDFDILDEALPKRKEDLRSLATRKELAEADIEPDLFSVDRLDVQIARLRREFQNIQQRITTTSNQLAQMIKSDKPADMQSLNTLIKLVTDLSGQLLELSLAQAGARLQAVVLEPVELTMEQALAIASSYRKDWMNARANLVDSWRLIYFNANDLRSDLNIFFSGDIGNVGDNPFNLRGSRGRLRAGVEFDAPLTRLAERNVYRQALIEYQQARRSYYQYRDSVYLSLRNTLRQIHLNEINFELRRAAVQVAISQVDLTQLRLSEPPQPGETAQFTSTTARDLVQALGDLLNVQNDFLSVWVNQEVQLLNLELDLGVMEVDRYGMRVENRVPFEVYLAGIPCNSADMGLEALDQAWWEMQNADSTEPLPPVKPLFEAEEFDPDTNEDAERLPPPEPEEPQSSSLRPILE